MVVRPLYIMVSDTVGCAVVALWSHVARSAKRKPPAKKRKPVSSSSGSDSGSDSDSDGGKHKAAKKKRVRIVKVCMLSRERRFHTLTPFSHPRAFDFGYYGCVVSSGEACTRSAER